MSVTSLRIFDHYTINDGDNKAVDINRQKFVDY